MAKKESTPKTTPKLAAAAAAAVREAVTHEKTVVAGKSAAKKSAKPAVGTQETVAAPVAVAAKRVTKAAPRVEMAAQATSPIAEPTRAEIAEQAYLYWEARGFRGGSEKEDWLRAEVELRQRALGKTASARA